MENMLSHLFKKKKKQNQYFKYNNWDEVPIDVYYRIRDIVLDESIKDIDKNIEVIALLKDTSVEDITSLQIDEVTHLMKQLKWVNNFEFDKKKTINKYKNCNVIYDLSKMSYAQFVDFQTYYQMGTEKYLPEIISTFLIPNGKTYNKDYDLIEHIEWIRNNVPITVAQNILFFFLVKSQNLSNLMLISLKLMMKLKLIRKIPKNLEKKIMELTNYTVG